MRMDRNKTRLAANGGDVDDLLGLLLMLLCHFFLFFLEKLWELHCISVSDHIILLLFGDKFIVGRWA